MQVQRRISDRISALPQETIEKILTHMPIRDALRTSILAKKWRYCWTRIPKLVFDDKLVSVSSDIKELDKYKLLHAIFHVLLLHKGPILELNIRIVDTNIFNGIDQIILHLSSSKNINRFIFVCATNHVYKLPCSFFALQGLKHLDLTYCQFEIPLVFNGFSTLKSLIFEDVTITANMLQRFLTSCPALKDFTFMDSDQRNFINGDKCTFVELFKCLPAVRFLMISRCYIKLIVVGGVPHKLPTSLVHLTMLYFEVCFLKQDEISSTLCVIRSSPNLETIKLKMFRKQTFNNLPDFQDYSGLNLDHLKELEIIGFHNYAPEMEFVKFIMAKSPLLEKARIELCKSVSVDEEVKMLRHLLHMQVPHASPEAKFIIERPRALPANTN